MYILVDICLMNLWLKLDYIFKMLIIKKTLVLQLKHNKVLTINKANFCTKIPTLLKLVHYRVIQEFFTV